LIPPIHRAYHHLGGPTIPSLFAGGASTPWFVFMGNQRSDYEEGNEKQGCAVVMVRAAFILPAFNVPDFIRGISPVQRKKMAE